VHSNCESITLHQDSTATQSSRSLQAIEEHKVGLESYPRLKGLHLKADTVKAQSNALHSDISSQSTIIEEINSGTTRIYEQTSRIEGATREASSSLAVINQRSNSILHGTTQILSMVTFGFITINSIGEQIYKCSECTQPSMQRCVHTLTICCKWEEDSVRLSKRQY